MTVIAAWLRPGNLGNLPPSTVYRICVDSRVDPHKHLQRAVFSPDSQGVRERGRHRRVACEVVAKPQGNEGEPEDSPHDHREMASNRNGHGVDV